MPQRKNISFITLGCKLNYSETSTISRLFPEEKYCIVKTNQGTSQQSGYADIYIINTCSVTGNADKKCRQAIKKVISRSPGAFVVVVGCYAQLRPETIATIPGVDLILGTYEKFNILNYLENTDKRKAPEIHISNPHQAQSFIPSYSIGDRTRTFLKIQDGCNQHCSYCTVPLARGHSRSCTISEATEQAEIIAGRGIKEIVLTGVNIGDFGKPAGESFYDLIKRLEPVEKIERFRISSIEPDLLTDEIIRFIAVSRKFAPHFHIPVQSGCNSVLERMRRRYSQNLITSRIKLIKELMPQAGIGVDIIVGFPGETESEFLGTYNFLRDSEVSYLHVFPFSPRKNTMASAIKETVSTIEKEQRSKLLLNLSVQKRRAFYEQNLGTTQPVLFESRSKSGFMHGFTGNYIKVEVPYIKTISNEIINVKLIAISENSTCVKAELP